MPSLRGLSLSALVAIAGVVLYAWLKESDFEPQPYELPTPGPLTGALSPNKHLRNAQLLLKGRVRGPESLLVEGRTVYTGTWDGQLLKVVDGAIAQTIRLAPPGQSECGTFDSEPLCGRPLGIRRLDGERLVVADAYLGVFLVDFDEGSWLRILAPHDVQPRAAFLNDVDVLDERTILLSDSSSRWDRRRFSHAFLEQKPEGRLLKLTKAPETAEWRVEVLLEGLYFANGVQILPDRQSVVVSECSMARIVRFHFDGPNRGRKEVFAENLPGFPDNIRLSSTGKTLLVGVASVRHAGDVGLLDKLGPLVWLRKLIGRIVPERYLGQLLTLVKKNYGMVLELDLEGAVVACYQDPGGAVIADVSQVSDDATHMYIGSYHSDFIAKVSKRRAP